MALEIFLPLILGKVMDAAIGKNPERVLCLLVQALLLFLDLSAINYLKNLTSTRVSTKMSEEIKNKMITKVMDLPMMDLDLMENGQIISKLGDAEILTGFFMSMLNNLMINVLSVVITAVFIFRISPLLAMIHCINVPVLYFSCRMFGKIIKDRERAMAGNRDQMNNFLFGMLQGIREIRALGGMAGILKEFLEIHRDYVNKQYHRGKISITLGSFNSLLSGITQVIFLLAACTEIIQGKLSLGMYYAFNAYAGRFSNALSVLTNMSVEVQTVSVAAERVIGYYEDTGNNKNGKKASIDSIQNIKADHVSFSYIKEMPVLQEMTFEFRRNILYVIVGSNGCGKSTFLNLIMNFYVPSEGAILLNDCKVQELEEKCLYSKVAYIRQNPFFFNRSVADNMRIVDKEFSMEQIKRTCKMVGMDEYIESLPQGYDTVLGDAGSHFSGGQIHRLALARSLLRGAEVYILDEITADLDGENEKIIMDILKQLVQNGKMVIMVSHRLSTIMKADHIIVMDHGRIAAGGTHGVLIKNCEVYKKLYSSEWESYQEYSRPENG